MNNMPCSIPVDTRGSMVHHKEQTNTSNTANIGHSTDTDCSQKNEMSKPSIMVSLPSTPNAHNNISVSMTTKTKTAKSNNKRRSSSSCCRMSSEYAALKDAATSLGTYQLHQTVSTSSLTSSTAPSNSSSSPASPQPAVHLIGLDHKTETVPSTTTKFDMDKVKEEAELLLRFMTSQPQDHNLQVESKRNKRTSCRSPKDDELISPSLSFEAQRHFRSDNHKASTTTVCTSTTSSSATSHSSLIASQDLCLSDRSSFSDDNEEMDNSLHSSTVSSSRSRSTSTSSTRSNSVSDSDDTNDSHIKSDTKTTFRLTCPSLSLSKPKSRSSFTTSATTATTHVSSATNPSSSCSTTTTSASSATHSSSKSSPHLTPAQLFARPLFTTPQPQTNQHHNSNAHILKQTSETLATNVMQSFLKALEYRSYQWMTSIAKSLDAASKLKNASNITEAPTTTTSPRKPSGRRPATFVDPEIYKSNQARVLRAIAHASKSVVIHDVRTTFQVLEQQIDRSTSSSSSSQVTSTSSSSTSSSSSARNIITPNRPLKKRRTMSGVQPHQEEQESEETMYKLSHAINLETKCTISTSTNYCPTTNKQHHDRMTIILQAPGVMDGTFLRHCRSSNSSTSTSTELVDVTIQLDTEALAQSMDTNSRLVIRAAAQEHILRPPSSSSSSTTESSNGATVRDPQGHVDQVTTRCDSYDSMESTVGEEEDEEEQEDEEPQGHPQEGKWCTLTPTATTTTYVDSNPSSIGLGNNNSNFHQYPQAATVTPMQRGLSSGSDSDEMPPPPPRMPTEEEDFHRFPKATFTLNPRRVSPSAMTSMTMASQEQVIEDSFASPTPTMKPLLLPTTMMNGDGTMTVGHTSSPPPPPFLVSPSPYTQESGGGSGSDGTATAMTTTTTTKNSGTKFVLPDSAGGPSLPALVEVACAAHAHCTA